MDARSFKDSIYAEFARVGKVLSSPKRLELLDLLSQAPRSVERLSEETEMSVANTSKHLQALLEARLVNFRKEKNYVIYQVASPKVLDLFFAIKAVAEEQLTGIHAMRDAFIVRPDQIETINLGEWIKRKDEGNHILIDVRPREEYESGHIEDAVSIPHDELLAYLQNLPKDKDIFAYCRGPYCVCATEAVELLLANGYKAFRLEATVHEWNQMQTKLVQ